MNNGGAFGDSDGREQHMARVKGCDAVYEVANQWRERCLERDGSLLWPDLEEPTWTVENLERLLEAFIGHPDEGSESFILKWKKQLESEPIAVHRIAADVMVVYSLFPHAAVFSPTAKTELVTGVAAWKAGVSPYIHAVQEAFSCGIGKPGTGYFTYRPWQVAYYLELALEVKRQQTALADPAETKKVVNLAGSSLKAATLAKDIVTHLLHPSEFEAIASQPYKEDIVRNINRELVEGIELPGETDEALAIIREQVGKNLGRTDFQFWDDDVWPLWHPNGPPSSRVWIEKAASWHSQSDPDVRSGQVLMYPTTDAAGHAIWASLTELKPGDVVLHLFDKERFIQRSVVETPAVEIEGGLHGYPGPHYLVELGYSETIEPPLSWTSVKESVGDLLLEVAKASKVPLFFLPHEDLKLRSPEGVTPAPPALVEVLNKASRARSGTDILPPNWPHGGLARLAALTHLLEKDLEILESLLSSKRQIILEGPPGSGKTYLARLFGRYLAGLPLEGPPDPQVEIVQFHQSYGYEDFVAGIRPRTTPEGTIRYDVQPGIFIEMCKRAEANPDKTFVLIIDEINRGNLSRIFGELLYALEYREEPVRLQYPDLMGDESADHLTIPKNLYLIGTMNSTDRSLAMIDYALRRRFYFWKLMPVVDGEAPVLEGWLRSKGIEGDGAERLLGAFVAINTRIADLLSPDYQIGHSYFMVEDPTSEASLDRVWRHAILPLLEEYLHSRRDRAAIVEELRQTMFGS
jgi:5-methylcytosine-specific restriction protein B